MPRKRDNNKFRRGGSQRYIRYAHAVSAKPRTTHSAHSFPIAPFIMTAFAICAVAITVITAPSVKLPPITIPELQVPTITIPKITIPEISVPSVSIPKVSLPTIQYQPPTITIPTEKISAAGQSVVTNLAVALSFVSQFVINAVKQFVLLIVSSLRALWQLQVAIVRMLLYSTGLTTKAIYTLAVSCSKLLVRAATFIANITVLLFRMLLNGISAIIRAVQTVFAFIGNKINSLNKSITRNVEEVKSVTSPYTTFLKQSIKLGTNNFSEGLKGLQGLVVEVSKQYGANQQRENSIQSRK